MRPSLRIAAAAGLSLFAFTLEANAFDTPAHLAGRPALEVAGGPAVRAQRMVEWNRVPRVAARAWARFVADAGPEWLSMWDGATKVPTRVWGAGIPAPGSVSSPYAAQKFARAFLEKHLALFAPGASIDDFVLAADDLDSGIRTLGFVQQADGMPVVSGQLSFRFKNDRLIVIASEALPFVGARMPHSTITPQKARAAAEQWVLSDMASTVKAGGVEGPLVLPLVGQNGVLGYRVVLRVTVDADAPIGVWSVYLDAATGAPVARAQTLRFATGTLFFNAPERWPGDVRLDYPAQSVAITVDGQAASSDDLGVITWPDGAPAQVVAKAAGPAVSVQNAAGPEATNTLALGIGASAVWNAASDPEVDSQLISFVHARKVREFAKSFAPQLGFLNSQVKVTVNISDVCNAFSDGTAINFYLAGSGCENTGRLADVVYHEYGHSIHAHGIIEGVGAFDGGLSEGLSDYLSATITGDPAMGRGFFFTSQPLRHIDPPNEEHKWPDDVGEEHYTGRIISGALWDLRKLLTAKLGPAEGAAQTNHLYYEGLRRAVDIPTMYPEVLAADDDDGNLDNGTPNACEIIAAFKPHGLYKVTAEATQLGVQPPTQKGYDVTLKIAGLFDQCAESQLGGANIEWRLRSDPSKTGKVPMAGAAGNLAATIPMQPDGEVVQYRVVVDLADGSTLSYPENLADPLYEFFVGEVEELYCTDFEKNPELEGWTHGLTEGDPEEGADDWQWGAPQGNPESGDPTEAYSGAKVWANDLGAGNFNGSYKPDKTNFTLSPPVDTKGAKNVRLQYRRWLNVEDGQFDKASIYANDAPVWSNVDSGMGDESKTHHRDKEWRFQDVDLTSNVKDGFIQVKFEINSDPGLEMGGWTLDDVCVVSYKPTDIGGPGADCGNGVVDIGEDCDAGDANSDTKADACRTTCRVAGCGDGVVDAGEACDDGNANDGDLCTSACIGSTPKSGDGNNLDEEADSGCGCRTAGAPREDGALYALALALGGLAVSRRVRRRRSS